jgi:hypothetical protein
MPYPSPHERGLNAQVRVAVALAAVVALIEIAILLAL